MLRRGLGQVAPWVRAPASSSSRGGAAAAACRLSTTGGSTKATVTAEEAAAEAARLAAIAARAREFDEAVEVNKRLTRCIHESEIFNLYEEKVFNVRNVATAIHRLGRLKRIKWDYRLTVLLQDAVVSLEEQPLRWDGQSMANVCWALGRMNIQDCPEFFELVTTQLRDRLNIFNAQDLRTLAWAYAKTKVKEPVVFATVADRLVSMGALKGCSTRDLSGVVWCFSTMAGAVQAPALFAAVARAAQPQVDRGAANAQDIYITAVAYAKSNERAPALFASLAAAAVDPAVFPLFKHNELAGLVWAVSTTGAFETRTNSSSSSEAATTQLYDAVEKLALEGRTRLKPFQAADVARLAWAYAAAGKATRPLLDAVADEALHRMDKFVPGSLAKLAFAFAEAQHPHADLFAALAKRTVALGKAFHTIELATVARAFVHVGIEAPLEFWEEVCCRVNMTIFDDYTVDEERISPAQQRALADMAWALSTRDVIAPDVYEEINRATLIKLDQMPTDHLVTILQAFSKARYAAVLLFDLAARKLLTPNFSLENWAAEAPARDERTPPPALVDPVKPPELAGLALAYAMAAAPAPDLFDAIATKALENIADFEPADLAKLAWAFVAQQVEEEEDPLKNRRDPPQEPWTDAAAQKDRLFAAVAARLPDAVDVFSAEDRALLYDVLVALQKNTKHNDVLLVRRLQSMGPALRAASANLREPRKPHFAHREMDYALTRLIWDHEFDLVTAEGHRLDLAQQPTRLAILYEPPTAYLRPLDRGSPPRLDGAARLKRRLVRDAGWHCLHVPHFEWEKMGKRRDKQDDYLLKAMSRDPKFAESLDQRPGGSSSDDDDGARYLTRPFPENRRSSPPPPPLGTTAAYREAPPRPDGPNLTDDDDDDDDDDISDAELARLLSDDKIPPGVFDDEDEEDDNDDRDVEDDEELRRRYLKRTEAVNKKKDDNAEDVDEDEDPKSSFDDDDEPRRPRR